jgi:hypothetical protein
VRKLRLDSTVGYERLLSGLLIAAGTVLRVSQYLANRSLRVDEAALAGSILPRSHSELTQSLDYRQVAPVGFLWIEKAVTSVFGESEYAFRLLPLLAGLISLFVFRSLARRVLASGPALLALAMFAFNRWLVFYSSDVKQYSTDVLACTWLLLVSVRSFQDPPNRARALGLALAGFAAGLLSYPALLISGSVLATTLGAGMRRRERGLAILSAMSLVWTIGSAASVAWSLRSTDPEVLLYLRDYWQRHGGMPALAEGWATIPRWMARAVREVGGSLADATFLPGRLEWALGIALASATVAGALWLWRSSRVRAAVLTLPILAAVASAILHRYPFSGRLVLFLYPSFLLLIAAAFEWMASARPAVIRLTATLGAVGLTSILAIRSVTVLPEHFEELRPVLREVSAHPRDGTVSYWLYSSAHKAFRYYTTRLSLPPGDVKYVCRAPDFWPHYVSQVASLDDRSRVWVILSHLRADEADFIRRCFDVFGKQDARYEDAGAAAYLYSMKVPDPSAVERLERSIPPARRARTRDCSEPPDGSSPVEAARPDRTVRNRTVGSRRRAGGRDPRHRRAVFSKS